MKLIKIIAQLNPFSTEKTFFEFESDTVINILKKIDANKAVNTGWRVMLNDQIVTDFETIVPEGASLYIKLVPEGDSPEESEAKAGVWVGVVASIAGAILLFIPGAQIMGGVLLGMGCFTLTSAGLTYINIQQQKLLDQEKAENDPSIRGSRNQSRPMQTIPTLLGKRRIYPDLIMTPYTEVDSSGNQYLCQLFCAGQKDQKIDTSSIKIEETLLKDYSATKNIETVLAGNDEHIKMKIHYGDSALTYFTKCVHEKQFNSILENKLEDDTSGAVIWTTPAGTTEINCDIFFYNGLGKYNDKGEITTAAVEVRAYYKPKDASDSDYQLIGNFSEYNVIFASELKTLRFSVTKKNLMPDSYTVKIERVSPDSDSSSVVDAVYLGSIRATKDTSPVRSEMLKKLCVIELKVKATSKLQNIIEQLNFVSQAKMPIYSENGTGKNSWTTNALTSNPASCAIMAMQGEMAQQKLKDSDIDWFAFEKLYKWCQSHNYECNYYLTESLTISQLLSNIATCSRSEIFRLNGKITVVQDIERDSPVQLFTPRNSKNYTETLLKTEIPDCLTLKFVNKDSGFAEDEVNVYNTSTGNKISEPEITQEVNLWGVTNSEQARKVGMYDLAVFRARSIVHTFQVDFEYMLCTKGDWIKYAGDIALAGLKQGRIQKLLFDNSNKIVGFVSDELLPMEQANNYAVRIRKNNGEIVLCDLAYFQGNHLEVYFVESYNADEFQEQNLFAFGIRGQETIDLIVTNITCQDNLTAEITAVEYAPAIFEVDSPNFVLPDFESKISDIPGVVDSGAVDLSDWRTFYTYNDSESQPSKPTGNGTTNGWHRNSTAQSKWVSSKTAKDINSGEWSAPSPTGSFVFDKLLSEAPTIDVPEVPFGLTAIAEKNGLKLSCKTKTGIKNTISKYFFEIKKDSSSWTQIESETSEAFYNFDAGSFYEASDFSSWRIRAKVQSVYGKESNYTSEITVNTDNYGTWEVQSPEVTVSGNKRFVSLNLSQPKRSDKKEIYGSVGYQILVNRPDLDGEDFFQPATNLDPQANELNYKTESKVPVVCSSNYMQELPLKGQNAKKWKFKYYEKTTESDKTKKDSVTYLNNIDSVIIPDNAETRYENDNLVFASWSVTTHPLTQFYEYTLVDMPSPETTYYRFKIVAQNLTSQNTSKEIIIGVYAKANSASDLVDNAITQNALADDAVTAEKIAAGTITAEQIAAEDILVKGARAGMVSTEGLIVDNSAFLASEALSYNYIDPETKEEKTYTATAGEFFVGNSPDVNDNRDKVDFLHYIPGVGFWFKIKNFIVKGLATIIQNVFRVKKSGAEDSESFFTVNSTDETDRETKTPANTVKVAGQILSETLHCPNISLKENVYGSFKLLEISKNAKQLTINNDFVYFSEFSYLYSSNSDYNNYKEILDADISIYGLIFKNNKIFVYGGGYIFENNNANFYNIRQYNSDFILEKSINTIFHKNTYINKIFEYKEGFLLFYRSDGTFYYTTDFENAQEIYKFPNPYITLEDSLTFVKNNQIYAFYRNFELKYIFSHSTDGVYFTEKEIDFYISDFCVINNSLFAISKSSNTKPVYLYKWLESENTFNLVTSFEIYGSDVCVYDETSDKLLAMEKDLIIFDGEKITTKLFLPEIQKKLIAVTDDYYLIEDTETNEFFSVKKDDEFLPIISDDKVTEQNTWSAKLLSEKLDKIYPVGSIYMSVVDNSPEIFYGGFWVKLKDRFLLGAGDEYTAGFLGGQNTVELSIDNLPSHTHTTKITDNGHAHTTYGNVSSTKSGVSYMLGGTGTDVHKSGTRASNSATTGISISVNSTGSGEPFSIMPPFIVVYMWKRVAEIYTLSFNANGGIGDIKTIKDESVIVILPENGFTREGYKFNSYNTKPDGTGEKYMPGENFSLDNNIILYAIWDSEISIPAGTYSPNKFDELISNFISENGTRILLNEMTAKVNNQEITIPAGATIHYRTGYNGVKSVGFGSYSTDFTNTGVISSTGFSMYKTYIVANGDNYTGTNQFANFNITISDITFE